MLRCTLAENHAFGATIATRDFAICITLLFSGCFVHPLHYLLAENHAFGATIATRIFAIYIPLHPFGVLGREFLHLQCAIFTSCTIEDVRLPHFQAVLCILSITFWRKSMHLEQK